MIIEGRALKYGDDINTDVILPGRYLVLTDPRELARHAMEGIDPSFLKKVSSRCILVAGRNFGCGSSREHAVIALKYSGIKAIIAESYARIFFRNALNMGLVAIECRGIARSVDEGDLLRIRMNEGIVENLSKNLTLRFRKYPPLLLEILQSGGLVNYLREKLKVRNRRNDI
ncbi:3-isopropylmalate dehydratase [Candidatus Geothermarchaeota archaeon]|nr:MAG: 3-isopropylmalate dehydratase [Candidatus Geothermarchaeota archaeon]